MKKEYKNPEVSVFELATEGVVAGSFSTKNETITSDEMMSNRKQLDIWDNDLK